MANKPSVLFDTSVIYDGDNLEKLRKLPDSSNGQMSACRMELAGSLKKPAPFIITATGAQG